MSADAEAEAEAFNDFLTVLLEEIRDEINLPLGRSAPEAVERPPEDAETENSTPLDEVKAKKKVRRGTRGRGRKINYKNVEDKEAEQNGGRKELTDAKASRDQHERQTERKSQTHTRVWTRRDRACESGWRGPAHCDQRDRRVPRRSAQETPSHAGA
ncbi:hypothetical protein PDJAM_G00086990 [Pangasius djambal]|uniref:Uncharacterized protein n=1 Tax=Pangasius djambal TaxID=1691987 RepID=A0ACC5Z418_9TELE|nr:hypothetical protein [Pangasius djambal]